MARCQQCGKGRSVGRKSRHRRGVASKKFANKASKKSRLFKPNLQKISFMAGGLALTMLLCARCIKKMKRGKRKSKPQLKLERRAKVSDGGRNKKAKSGGEKREEIKKPSRKSALKRKSVKKETAAQKKTGKASGVKKR